MITTYVFDTGRETYDQLKNILLGTYPSIQFMNFLNSPTEVGQEIAKANLLFVNVGLSFAMETLEFTHQSNCELIGYGRNKQDAFNALKLQVSDFLLLPLGKEPLLQAVGKAYKKIIQHKSANQHVMVGIPTMEGVEYLKVGQIIKCEGLQKCTRIFTTENKKIVSSYNIGEFSKLLQPYNFFAPHRSFLINLNHIKRYNKEGIIYLTDNETAPLARRRKQDFLSLIPLV